MDDPSEYMRKPVDSAPLSVCELSQRLYRSLDTHRHPTDQRRFKVILWTIAQQCLASDREIHSVIPVRLEHDYNLPRSQSAT